MRRRGRWYVFSFWCLWHGRFEKLTDLCSLQVMLIDPAQFKTINDILQKECKGRGRLETLEFSATA